MKKFVRQVQIDNIKNGLNSQFPIQERKDYINFLQSRNIDIDKNLQSYLTDYSNYIITEIENGNKGEQIKNDWLYKTKWNDDYSKREFLSNLFSNQYISLKPYDNSNKPYQNDSYLKEIDYIKKDILNKFYIELSRELRFLFPSGDYSINAIECFKDNWKSLDNLVSTSVDIKNIENFIKIIDNLLQDGITIETLVYSLKTRKYKELNNLYYLLEKDLLNKK